ncbi:MAG: type II toxin-antitoxin system Phd/YefM family antitoxin [Patulibacter sp.]|nr:type II toxin-antitoxin system Phd/YefM family antitoxin [Patulibacter sp.]
MSTTIASAEARKKLPQLLDQLRTDPAEVFVIGRQRQNEAVLMSFETHRQLRERLLQLEDELLSMKVDLISAAGGDPVSAEDVEGRFYAPEGR